MQYDWTLPLGPLGVSVSRTGIDGGSAAALFFIVRG